MENDKLIAVVLVLITVLVLAFVFMYSSFGVEGIGGGEEKSSVDYTVNTEFSEKLTSYLSFSSYDCKDTGSSIKCEGVVNYIGPYDYEANGGVVLYCYKQTSVNSACAIDSDVIATGTMNEENKKLPFTLRCNYGSHDEFEVTLGIGGSQFTPPHKYC